jgi:hypothetical protein
MFDIIGDVEPEALIVAINKAFNAFESTMSKIVLASNGEAYYEKMQISGCLAKITQLDWDRLIKENEKTTFSIQTGELMRVFVKPLKDKTTVFIMAHHLVGDGKSIIYFIERIMKEYIGETDIYHPLRLLTENSFPKESRLPSLIRCWVKGLNRNWKKTGKVFGWNDYCRLHETYWKKRESIVLTRSFSLECIESIHSKAMHARVSMNSYILTAFLKADTDLRSIGLAVNARMDGNRSMSNQATGITVDYSYNKNLSFEENAQRLHKKIYHKLDKPHSRYFILRLMPLFTPTLVDSILMHTWGLYENQVTKRLSKTMGYTSVGKTRFGITNLTKLDIPNTYKAYGIANLYFIPPVVSYSGQTIGIATTESSMTITCHCMSDTFNEKKKQVFHSAMEILSSI